ncbi:MAG: hypothetical protein R2769_14330 [Saprospiraceae bacterium]
MVVQKVLNYFLTLKVLIEKIEIYTTRPDTIFGATFMVVAPEHDWVAEITTAEQKAAVEEYQTWTKSDQSVKGCQR